KISALLASPLGLSADILKVVIQGNDVNDTSSTDKRWTNELLAILHKSDDTDNTKDEYVNVSGIKDSYISEHLKVSQIQEVEKYAKDAKPLSSTALMVRNAYDRIEKARSHYMNDNTTQLIASNSNNGDIKSGRNVDL